MAATSLSAATLMLALLGGFGLPLGVPPAPENPAMAHVAPAKCLTYGTWAAMAEPDPESANHTEQLFAEPEVQRFFEALDNALETGLKQALEDAPDARGDQVAKYAPRWARALLTKSAAYFVESVEVNDDQVDVRGGLLVQAGKDSGELVDALVQVLSSDERQPESVTIGKRKYARFAREREAWPIEITLGSAGDYVLIGIGEGSVEGMIERLAAKKTPDWLTRVHERFPLKRRSTVSYLNTQAAIDAVLPLAGPPGEKIVESLGLRQLGAVMAVSGLDEEGIVSHTFIPIEGKSKGLLALLDGAGLKPEQLNFLPSDATFAMASSFNAKQLLIVIEDVVIANVPDGSNQVDRAHQFFQESFGFHLKDEVLSSLGEVWTLSVSPADGWLGATATVEVNDSKTIRAVLRRGAAMLSESREGPRGLRVESSKIGEHEIQTLSIPGMPIQPAWTVTESQIVFALTPQAVKGAVSVEKKQSGIFSQPEFKQAFQGPGRVIGISYQNTPKIFEGTYSYLAMVVPLINQGMSRGRRGEERPPIFDPAMLPTARSIHRHLRPSTGVTRRTPEGLEMESHQTLPTPTVGAAAPVVVALGLPAVQAAREAARRSQSLNNLKQIMLALHNYHDTHRGLPPAHTFDANKKPGLSWRVLILPYIEQDALYKQFHLDEPWDSEHNKKLIAQMPEVFKSPNSAAGEGKTNYLGIGGKKGAFPPPALPMDDRPLVVGLSFKDFTDGLSNTVVVVETNDKIAEIWTKPGDYEFNEKEPLQGLTGLRPGGFLVGMGDGSVRFISERIMPDMLKNLFERNDGKQVDID
jgi:hypothetical protein